MDKVTVAKMKDQQIIVLYFHRDDPKNGPKKTLFRDIWYPEWKAPAWAHAQLVFELYDPVAWD